MPKRKHDQTWYKEEKEIVRGLEKLGYSARRQPGSGNRAVDLQHDCVWRDSPAGKLHIEAKYRETCLWKKMETWRAGADILTVREARGKRMAFLEWDLLLQLVGEANANEEYQCDADRNATDRMFHLQWNRERIQSAHRNPPPKPPVKRKLQGRGFSKQKVKADDR